MKRRLLLQLLLGFVLGVGLVIGYNVFAKPYSYQGSLIDPPAQAADFSLESADGSVFRLADQRGQVVVLFFGYTHCPDVCPTTLYDFTQIKERLGPKAEQVKFVMITSDPERDHPDVVENYVSGFDSEFIGLSGSLEELQPVWDAFWVYREKTDLDGEGEYLLNHTARIYVIDPGGNLRLTFPSGMATEAMTDDLLHLMEGNQ